MSLLRVSGAASNAGVNEQRRQYRPVKIPRTVETNEQPENFVFNNFWTNIFLLDRWDARPDIDSRRVALAGSGCWEEWRQLWSCRKPRPCAQCAHESCRVGLSPTG